MKKLALAVLFGLLMSGVSKAQSIGDLTGDWIVTSGTLAGVTVPANSLSSMSLKINGNNFDAKSGSLTSGGMVALAQEGTFQLNFMINRGADSGKTVRALYSFSDGILTITYSQDDRFPLDHSSTAENKYCVLKYRKGSNVDEDDTTIVSEGNAGSGAAAGVVK